MRRSNLVRYILWTAVLGTAIRNRREYRVPTAWLTHLCANTVTLFLPELIQLSRRLSVDPPPRARPFLRTVKHRVVDDPHYAGYVAPLALGFVASHPDYSIYHGRWAERTLFGFGVDSIPHATAAYALARLMSETTLTLQREISPNEPIAPLVNRAAQNVDGLAVAVVVLVTICWEVSEYLAHTAEVRATGRDPHDVNMQWSPLDAVTDSVSNIVGLLAAIRVRHASISERTYEF